MAKLVDPYTVLVQGREDVVLYELPWAKWNDELLGHTTQTVTFTPVDGGPATMVVLGDRPSVSRVLIHSRNGPGRYLITRTVEKWGVHAERRVKTFQVVVE